MKKFRNQVLSDSGKDCVGFALHTLYHTIL